VPVEDGLAEGVFEAVCGVVLLDEGLDFDQAGELGRKKQSRSARMEVQGGFEIGNLRYSRIKGGKIRP